MTLMPTPLLDPTYTLAVKAIVYNAFHAGYYTIDEMLSRPWVDSTGEHPIVLEWKKELLEQRVFEMSCSTFRLYFRRLCLVAGLEKPHRPYFLRIGAGANFEDKGMPSSLKYRILSHTEKVHNQRYQSTRVRQDMQGAAFGLLAGDNGQLFKHLEYAWKGFHPLAPIYMIKKQAQQIELRQDTIALRRRTVTLRKSNATSIEIRSHTRLLRVHIKRLEELAILSRREPYFRDIARSRQLGLQHPQPEQKEAQDSWEDEDHYTGTSVHSGLNISALLQAWAPATVFNADVEARSLAAMAWLVDYLTGNLVNIFRPEKVTSPITLQLPAGMEAMCLICGKAFRRRADMTRHSLKHVARLSGAFSCPQCGHVTSSPSEFSNHAEQAHGKQYTPYFTTESARKIPCAICHRNIGAGSILDHFNSTHAAESRSGDERLTCTACPDERDLDVDTWLAHLVSSHGVRSAEQCPFCNLVFMPRAIPVHIRKSHF
ncbi:Zinc finger Y-chromosomal protein [Cytospora mali]|uniref:Zinc finger Y-chromosomal protein n=1 Tax=Cytospora mali TaxID=578113 RepID=A0A194VK37_CYTMA|nr:Zinc finger Y-chromosomal protein [Valsa mali]